MAESRAKYIEMMCDILDNGASFSVLKNEINDNSLAFCNMLMMTAFRNITFIKYDILPNFVKKKIKQRILKYILYLGVTELLFMDTPDYAVLNSYVEVAKRETDKFGANFVNAVLRNVLRHKEDLLKQKKERFFSDEFRRILKRDYSDKVIQRIEKFAGIEPPLDITLKSDIRDYKTDGRTLPNGSIRFPSNTKVVELPDYADGIWWVQDAGASMAVKCLEYIKGKKVLDVCAAPGGKTAQLLDKGAIVTALDISEQRLKKLSENMNRLNFNENLSVKCGDALNFESDEKFDIILLDAPCSATGTFRRHPEIMHTKSLSDVHKQAELQRKILNHIIDFLAPNGVLVYATCSLAKDEGEKQILSFVKEHTDFQIDAIKSVGTKEMRTSEGFLRILPQHYGEFSGIDGFFVARLQRKI